MAESPLSFWLNSSRSTCCGWLSVVGISDSSGGGVSVVGGGHGGAAKVGLGFTKAGPELSVFCLEMNSSARLLNGSPDVWGDADGLLEIKLLARLSKGSEEVESNPPVRST